MVCCGPGTMGAVRSGRAGPFSQGACHQLSGGSWEQPQPRPSGISLGTGRGQGWAGSSSHRPGEGKRGQTQAQGGWAGPQDEAALRPGWAACLQVGAGAGLSGAYSRPRPSCNMVPKPGSWWDLSSHGPGSAYQSS